MAYSTAVQRQNLRAVRCEIAQPSSQPCSMTSRCEPGRRRPKASELQEGALHGRLEASAKLGAGASAAGPSSQSELGAPCTRRWSPCYLQELYARALCTTAVYGPRCGAVTSAAPFKRGLCEYFELLPFSAPRARQSPRPARRTLRPASRYTDGRHRPPPPSCNCVSGSREPNRALREQQAPTARHTTQRKLKRRSHGLGRALAHGGLRAHRPRPS